MRRGPGREQACPGSWAPPDAQCWLCPPLLWAPRGLRRLDERESLHAAAAACLWPMGSDPEAGLGKRPQEYPWELWPVAFPPAPWSGWLCAGVLNHLLGGPWILSAPFLPACPTAHGHHPVSYGGPGSSPRMVIGSDIYDHCIQTPSRGKSALANPLDTSQGRWSAARGWDLTT